MPIPFGKASGGWGLYWSQCTPCRIRQSSSARTQTGFFAYKKPVFVFRVQSRTTTMTFGHEDYDFWSRKIMTFCNFPTIVIMTILHLVWQQFFWYIQSETIPKHDFQSRNLVIPSHEKLLLCGTIFQQKDSGYLQKNDK